MKNILLFIVVAGLLTGCFLPKEYKLGVSQYNSSNYAAAVSNLEKAYKLKPGNAEVVLAYAKAQLRYVQAKRQAAKADHNDLRNNIKYLTEAKEANNKGFKAAYTFINAMSPKDKEKYKNNGDINRVFVKGSKIKTEHWIYALRNSFMTETVLTDSELDFANAMYNSAMSNIKAAERNIESDIDAAHGFARAVQSYQNSLPEARAIFEKVTEAYINHYEAKALSAIETKDFAEAQSFVDKIKNVKESDSRLQAAVTALESAKSFSEAKYLMAYTGVLAIEKIKSDHSFVTNHKNEYLDKLIATSTAEAQKYAVSHKIPELIKALEAYATLKQHVADPSKTGSIVANSEVVKKKISAIFRAKAELLYDTDNVAYSGIYLYLMKTAFAFSPIISATEEDKIFTAQGVMEEKQKMRLLISVQDNTSQNNAYASDVFNKLINKFDGKPAYKLVSYENNPESGKKSDMQVSITLDTHQFRETGADRPIARASQYISGTRWVHNPEWDKAQEAYRSAQATYDSLIYQRNEAMRSCGRLGNPFAQGLCRAAIGMVSSSGVNSARATADSTPMQIEEQVVSTYYYDEFNISVRGNIRATVNYRDNINMKRFSPDRFNENVNAQGQIIDRVMPTDTNRLTNARINVPELQTETFNLEKLVTDKIEGSVTEKVEGFYGVRFSAKAAVLAGSGKNDDAAELYVLMKDSPQGAEAVTNLEAYREVNKVQYENFCISDSELSGRWPVSPIIPTNEQLEQIDMLLSQ